MGVDSWDPIATDRGTLLIDFVWKDEPSYYCGECGKCQMNRYVRRCVPKYGLYCGDGSCGSEFAYVSTRALDQEWQEAAAADRPDLEFRPNNGRWN